MSIELKSATLKAALMCAGKSGSTRPNLSSVLVEFSGGALHIVGTDGEMLFAAREWVEGEGDFSVAIPRDDLERAFKVKGRATLRLETTVAGWSLEGQMFYPGNYPRWREGIPARFTQAAVPFMDWELVAKAQKALSTYCGGRTMTRLDVGDNGSAVVRGGSDDALVVVAGLRHGNPAALQLVRGDRATSW